jgi:hypothetical protein
MYEVGLLCARQTIIHKLDVAYTVCLLMGHPPRRIHYIDLQCLVYLLSESFKITHSCLNPNHILSSLPRSTFYV